METWNVAAVALLMFAALLDLCIKIQSTDERSQR